MHIFYIQLIVDKIRVVIEHRVAEIGILYFIFVSLVYHAVLRMKIIPNDISRIYDYIIGQKGIYRIRQPFCGDDLFHGVKCALAFAVNTRVRA